MKLLYLSASYVPSRQANSMQVMRMCSAFARQGHDVELFTRSQPNRQEPGVGDDFAFYGISRGFAIQKLDRPSRAGGSLIHTWKTAALLRERQPDLVYARAIVSATVAVALRLPLVFEAHAVPSGRWARWMWERMLSARTFRRLVVTSAALERDLRDLGLIPEHVDVVVAHDAADPLPEFARTPGTSPRIGYIGSLYPGRGIEVVIELARRMPDAHVVVVGGRQQDLQHWQQQPLPHNLNLVGFVPPSQLGQRYAELDIVLMPYPASGVRNSGGGSDMSRWMSPLKLFEYMSSGAAIVSSDLPVLAEVLRHEDNALLVSSDDLDAWQRAVRRLADDRQLRERLAGSARAEMLATHTWDARANAVLSGLRTEGCLR